MTVRRLAWVGGIVLSILSPSFPATAQRVDISPDYDPAIYRFAPPTRVAPGQARIRLVQGQGAVVALGPDQFWVYEEVFRRDLAHLSQRMSVARAEPRARASAVAEVMRRWPRIPVERFTLVDAEPAGS